MALSSTSIGLIALLIICILLGYEFVSFDHLESIEPSPTPQNDLAPQILDEVKRVEEELLAFKSANQPDTGSYRGYNDEISKLLDSKFETFQQLMQESIAEMTKPIDSQNTDFLIPEEVQQTTTPAAGKVATTVKNVKSWKNLPLALRVGQYGKDQCERKEKVYFLKTSKTGSTTMANILMRFGFSRPGTNYLMGESPNGAMFFLNGYMPYNEELCYMGRDIPNRPHFDISYIHMRYNRTAIDRVMHPNTFKVSILRDPLDNFMSSWKYYNGLTKEMRVKINADIKPTLDMDKNPDWYKEIEQFLKKPWEYLSSFAYSHSAYLFVVNPQFIFFGYPSYLLQNSENRLINLVDNWIQQIEGDFDHIIILEDLDRSLAVLMLKLCWSIEDVVHLKLNQMTKDGKSINLTAKKQLHDLNWADYRLYAYFKRKLDREVQIIGTKKVREITDAIVKRAGEVSAECLQPDKTTGWISSPIIKADKRRNQTCNLYVKDISGYIEAEQVIRWKADYPEWRMSSKKMATKTHKGTELPDFCGPNESFQEWLIKKDKEFRDFLHWPTNNDDFRNYIPTYLDEFATPLTPAESKDSSYVRLFN